MSKKLYPIVHLKDISDTPTTTPPSGYVFVYSKTDNRLYLKDSNGNEFLVSGSIEGALDSEISGLLDNDIIRYDANLQKFVNVPSIEYDGLLRLTQTNVSSNMQLTLIVPAGYIIDECVIVETSGATAGDISLGTSSGATEIINNYTIDASDDKVVPLGQQYFSSVNDTNLYISSTSWGNGIINIYLLIKKIL